MKELDVVTLKEDIPYEILETSLCLCDDIPKEGLKKGIEGVIVHVVSSPSLVYLVELFDVEGKEIGQMCLEPHQIKLTQAFP